MGFARKTTLFAILCTLVCTALTAPAARAATPRIWESSSRTLCPDGSYAVDFTIHGTSDASTLSDSQLRTFHFPPRPKSHQYMGVWARFVHAGTLKSHCATPSSVKHPLMGSTGRNVATGPMIATDTRTNWAGYVTNAGGTYDSTDGYIIVPAGTAAPGDQAYSSSWFGLSQGSSTSVPLIQSGVDADEEIGLRSFTLWWEVWPNNSAQIVSHDVGPGDILWDAVARYPMNYNSPPDDHYAFMQLWDEQTGAGGNFDYPGTFGVDGTTEAILERPVENGWVYHLAQSTPVFGDWEAYDEDTDTVSGGGDIPHYGLEMTTCGGSPMASPGPISVDPDWGHSKFQVNWIDYGDIYKDGTC